MADLAGASPASEPPDRSLPPRLAAYSPSHRSIPNTVHQFPDLVKKPSFSTNQVIISTQVSPEIDAAVHTSFALLTYSLFCFFFILCFRKKKRFLLSQIYQVFDSSSGFLLFA